MDPVIAYFLSAYGQPPQSAGMSFNGPPPNSGMSYTPPLPAPMPPPQATPQSAGMSFTPPLPFDYNQWAKSAGNGPGQGPNSVGMMPTQNMPTREVGFAPGFNAGEGGASMPGEDPMGQAAGQRASAMDYAGEIQKLAHGNDPSMKRDQRRALSDALAIFGAKMVGDKPSTVLGKITAAVAPGVVAYNASEAATQDRQRKWKDTQTDNLLKALQIQGTNDYRESNLDLKEKLGLMAADSRNEMADIKRQLGQGNLDLRGQELAQRRKYALDTLNFKRSTLDARVAKDGADLKLRLEAINDPFKRQWMIDKAIREDYTALGLNRPDNFYGDEYEAAKKAHQDYVDGLQKWMPGAPTTGTTPQPGATGTKYPTVSIGAYARGPNGARVRWDGTAWQPA